MVQAFAGVALLEFGQVEPGAEMFAFAGDDRRAGFGRQVLEGVAQRFDQAVAQGIAFGGAAQSDDGDRAAHLQSDTAAGRAFKQGVCHVTSLWAGEMNKVIVDNYIVGAVPLPAARSFPRWPCTSFAL